MSRISGMFERKRAAGESALIGYITAGDPHPDRTPELALALERGGVDLIELGVPFSDPIADGPVIQRASARALAAGTRLEDVLEAAQRIREQSEIPLLLFSYLNPLLRYGFEKLASDAKKAGIDGLLMTDLTVEEADPYRHTLREYDLDAVFLAAPTSPPERLRRIAKYSSGFIYLVSRTGVTGERDRLSSAAAPLVEAMRKVTELPVAIGFGISRAEHARETARIADGVVVGSAIVRLVEEHGGSAGLEQRLEELARELKGGVLAR